MDRRMMRMCHEQRDQIDFMATISMTGNLWIKFVDRCILTFFLYNIYFHTLQNKTYQPVIDKKIMKFCIHLPTLSYPVDLEAEQTFFL